MAPAKTPKRLDSARSLFAGAAVRIAETVKPLGAGPGIPGPLVLPPLLITCSLRSRIFVD